MILLFAKQNTFRNYANYTLDNAIVWAFTFAVPTAWNTVPLDTHQAPLSSSGPQLYDP